MNNYKNSKLNENLAKEATVIYNLIDAEDILKKSQEKISEKKLDEIFTFLNVGRHTEEDKKITRLIEATKKLNENNLNFRLLLVGCGNKTEEYKNMVKKYNLEEKIIFLGKKTNPYPYFKISDSLILTSEYEGFPVVYLEAMVLDTPIITTDVSDSKQIIQDKFGIVTQKDVDSIYNAMKDAILHGINVKEKFDYEKYNQDIKEKLDKIINY